MHTLRNYVSHANEAIDKSHIDGENNKFYVYKSSLINFIKHNIDLTSKKSRKEELKKQLEVINKQEDYIDLLSIADKAIKWIRECEHQLMDYQIEPQLIQSCNILSQTWLKINEEEIKSDHWEIWTSNPMYLDHAKISSMTLKTSVDGKEETKVVFNIPINWQGCLAVIEFVYNKIKLTTA